VQKDGTRNGQTNIQWKAASPSEPIESHPFPGYVQRRQFVGSYYQFRDNPLEISATSLLSEVMGGSRNMVTVRLVIQQQKLLIYKNFHLPNIAIGVDCLGSLINLIWLAG
jgi:hypothetical protein